MFFIILFSQFISAQEIKNQKILSFETKKEMMDYMKKEISAPLGVKCSYCHNVRDFASDDKKEKEITRQMMIMTNSINKNTMNPLAYDPVNCWTCHQGNTDPLRSKAIPAKK
tara:strand:+ start:13476 stop:13811 length:336 start_codon:yes stop_codon:yes gene_type:complete